MYALSLPLQSPQPTKTEARTSPARAPLLAEVDLEPLGYCRPCIFGHSCLAYCPVGSLGQSLCTSSFRTQKFIQLRGQ